ncbi:hypothetical protein NQ317_015988 [Molorchus minor]|uniref:Ig-like domain-containing protein n=1 Tax=Molorchus minor TaxID=1323400 RepID=A0ABQ9JK55_9CUCU|nr:hypothetical protein NQ317_015988 [Molorchus minor]
MNITLFPVHIAFFVVKRGNIEYFRRIPLAVTSVSHYRKQSRLTIKRLDAESWGQYECIAEGANGEQVSRAVTVSDPSQTLSESFSSGI